MSTYRETLTAPLPPAGRRQLSSDCAERQSRTGAEANRSNNVGFSSSTIAVTVPLLPLGTPSWEASPTARTAITGWSPSGKGREDHRRFSPTTGAAEVFVRYPDLPDRTNFDQATSASDRQQRLLITIPREVRITCWSTVARSGRAAPRSRCWRKPPDSRSSRSLPRAAATMGSASVEVIGSQFTPQTTLSLTPGQRGAVNAQSVQFVDTNHLRAIFDLTDCHRAITATRRRRRPGRSHLPSTRSRSPTSHRGSSAS